MHFSAMYRLRR